MPKNTSFEVKIAVMNLEDDDKYVINQTNFRNNFPHFSLLCKTEATKTCLRENSPVLS